MEEVSPHGSSAKQCQTTGLIYRLMYRDIRQLDWISETNAHPSLFPILPCTFSLPDHSTDPRLLCLIHSLLHSSLMSSELFLVDCGASPQESTQGSSFGSHERHQCVKGIVEPVWLFLSGSPHTQLCCRHDALLQYFPVFFGRSALLVWVLHEALVHTTL